jgi:SAM-dependent methyltransferase
MGYYQSINDRRGERSCEERWELIKKEISSEDGGVVLDIGCAEGYFCKKIAEETNYLAVGLERDKKRIERQKIWANDDYIGRVVLCRTDITSENINLIAKACDWVEVTLLLSVLHWMKNPDSILKDISSFSQKVIIEIPNLDDKKACGQDFIKGVAHYGGVERYLKEVSGRDVRFLANVKAHTSSTRSLWIIEGDVSRFSKIPHVNMKLPTNKRLEKYRTYEHHLIQGEHNFIVCNKMRKWICGINLATLDHLGIFFPDKEWFIRQSTLELQKIKNVKGDARYHNIIIVRDGLQWIDLWEKGGKNRYVEEIKNINNGKNKE